jgi:hypothetical protein
MSELKWTLFLGHAKDPKLNARVYYRKKELLKNLGLPILKIGNMDLYINATCRAQESFIKS